jgi:lysophospholipase L1-like esterase
MSRLSPVHVAPYALFLYVLGGLVLARSESPVVLGRYSLQAAGLLVVCGAVYVAAIAAGRSARPRLAQLTLLVLAALTFVVLGSNAVQRIPFVQYVLPAVRLLIAVALIAYQADRFRRAGAPNGPALAAAMVLAVWAATDVTIAVITRAAPPHAQASTFTFRHEYALDRIPEQAIALIGDSFVWGQGVEADQTFGARLEWRLKDKGRAVPVYSLGVVGAGLRSYGQILDEIPAGRRVDRVALVYYVNDMPSKPRVADTVRNQMITLGVGAPTLRLVGDLIGRSMTPTLEQFNARLVEDYDTSSPTFAGRWSALRSQLEAFQATAVQRSRRAPLLVILPLMVDFDRYPLTEAHANLASLGAELGFQVVDMLPAFRDELRDGREFLVAADDNHFDARAHDVVAARIEAALVP